MARKEDKSISFEKQLAELQQIVDRLETGETELEPSLALFEKGVGLYRDLKTRLQRAEARVEKLVYDLEGAARSVPVADDEHSGADPAADAGEDDGDDS